MNCPVCKKESLNKSALEDNLPSFDCTDCGGSWVEAEPYSLWMNSRPQANLAAGEVPVSLVSGEGFGLKFCPHCSYILVKYKVGHDVNFSIDRCGHCGGVWFDKNEWQILKAHNLHSHVHDVFSQEWQSSVRKQEHESAMKSILQERLGDTDFAELLRIKDWLDNHPKSDELYALLFGSRKGGAKPRSLHRVFR